MSSEALGRSEGVSIPLLSLTSDQLHELARERIGPGFGVWREIYRDAMVEGRFEPERWGLSKAAVSAWRRHFSWAPLARARQVDEPSLHATDDRRTIKMILRTHDGLELESVRVPMSKGRNTLCLSSQVGCRLACRFCETGRLGLLRNLTVEEIVAQVIMARTHMGWSIHNLVFMGMGEPLDNVTHLVQALRVLTDSRGLAYGQQKMTVCTSGIPDGLRALGDLAFKRMGLSFSLNAAVDEKRDKLMPINRRYPLAEVQKALRAYPKREGFVLALNYCLLPGWNDTPEDAKAVARFAQPLGRTLVNVIPYNPGTKPIARPPTEEETEAFIHELKREGLAVRMRRTKGRSVMAACGQLGNLELRQLRGAQREPSGLRVLTS